MALWYGMVYKMVLWCGMVCIMALWYGMVYKMVLWCGMVYIMALWYGMMYKMVLWCGMVCIMALWYGMVCIMALWYGMVYKMVLWCGMVCIMALWYGAACPSTYCTLPHQPPAALTNFKFSNIIQPLCLIDDTGNGPSSSLDMHILTWLLIDAFWSFQRPFLKIKIQTRAYNFCEYICLPNVYHIPYFLFSTQNGDSLVN